MFQIPTAGHQRGKQDASQIVAAYVPYKRRGQPVRPTMLFSHGNAVDLGQMMPFYKCARISSTRDVQTLGSIPGVAFRLAQKACHAAQRNLLPSTRCPVV